MFPHTDTSASAPAFDAPLPRGLREQAAGLTFDELLDRYGQWPGPLRLGAWECAEAGRGTTIRNYRASLGIGDRIVAATAAATGPLSALTAMLYHSGIAVETSRFHQLRAGEDTVTFVECGNGTRHEWAMAVATDATASALRAVIAAANRLYG